MGDAWAVDASMTELLAALQRVPPDEAAVLDSARSLLACAQFEAALARLAGLNGATAAALRNDCFLQSACWALEVGELERADWAAEQLLFKNSHAVAALTIRGEVASLRGEDAQALELFQQALALLPQGLSVSGEELEAINRLLYLRVAMLVRLRRYPEALEAWRAVVNTNEGNPDLWYLGALCLVQMGHAAEALPLCERALAADKRHIDAGKLRRQLVMASA
jgi:tetratricopeptide (TPR) repeat protein